MLEIKNLHAEIDGKEILKEISLTIKAGEVHAIMGPNGAGKSTLSAVIAGRDGYEITAGDILFNGESILDWSVDQRANAGVFLAMQYPVELPGVNSAQFLRACINAKRAANNDEEMDAITFLKTARKAMQTLDMDEKFLKRAVNAGFSGGEKKRYETLQMALLEPSLCIMDETDSGLDIDALRIVAEGINTMRDDSRSFVMITHYQRLLDYVTPDYVHILAGGKIVKSGDKTLALALEEKGYALLQQECAHG